LISAASHLGIAPRPAQVSDRFFGLRYFGATFRPFIAPRLPSACLPEPFQPLPPSWASCWFSSSAFRLRTRPISSRSLHLQPRLQKPERRRAHTSTAWHPALNGAGASIKLALSGYYQKAFNHVRDLLETYFLVHYPTTERAKIAEWKAASKKIRIARFGASFAMRSISGTDT
jgi:hypothetical protein